MSGYGYTSSPEAPLMQGTSGAQPIGTIIGGQAASGSGSGNPAMVGKIAGEVAATAEKGSMLQKGGTALEKFFAFYGGETVSQIKSRSNLKVTGGSDSLKTGEDKAFYNNVSIPRKKV